MASLKKITERGRDGWSIRLYLNKKRTNISLPPVDEADARLWVKHLDHLKWSMENGASRDPATRTWLRGLPDDLHLKLSKQGLDAPRAINEPEPIKPITVKEYCDSFSQSIRCELKTSSQTSYGHTVKRLNEFFGTRPIESISPMDARNFRTWLKESSNKRDRPDENGKVKELAENTIRRRMGVCKLIFGEALTDGLIARNPFAGIPSTVRSNKERQEYVPMETFSLVLEKAPDCRWKLLMILARTGALRIPSEVFPMLWSDIDWNKKRLLIHCIKTEHHAKHATRTLPMFPLIETALIEHRIAQLKSGLYDPAGKVFPDINEGTNLRTRFESIIRRAEVRQWPKLWQNLRSSGATDMAKNFPAHIATQFCGHTSEVALEHYWTVMDSDFNEALATDFGKLPFNADQVEKSSKSSI